MGSGEVDELFPLTPVQQGILLHSVANPGLGVYINQAVIELTGPLRTDLLRKVWHALVARHTILRTAFVWQGLEEPLQATRPTVELPWTELDWRDVPPERRADQLTEFLESDRARGFELAKAPLIRVTLARTADRRWWMVWSHHHILLDGWSTSMLMAELFERYCAAEADREPPVREARPYSDYVAWLQRRRSADAEDSRTYWRETLAGFVSPTSLPLARRSPRSEQSYGFAVSPVPMDTLERLRALCRHHRLTMATVLHAAWALLLARFSGRQDVLFGSVMSGRPPELAGVEAMVGLLVNTLPVRMIIDESMPVMDWLAQVHARLAEIRDHEHDSLVEVQRCSEIPAGTELFSSIVVVENYPTPPTWLDHSDVTITDAITWERPHYPFTVSVTETDQLSVRYCFDRRLFDDEDAQAVGRALCALLESVATATEQTSVRELSAVLDTDVAALLGGWAEGPPGEPLGTTLADSFQAQAAATPDATAVVSGSVELSYRELADRVNWLAGELRTLGVRPETVVAVLLDRSIEAIVGVLGVIVAGGAVAPMNPEGPKGRISELLTACGARFVITAGSAAELLPEASAQTVIRLDRMERNRIGVRSPVAPPSVVHPDNLCYVIGTSGSTGQPKAVMATHRGVLNFLGYMQREYPIRQGDRVAQQTSVGFDASVLEVYWPFLVGASLLVPDASAKDPEALSAELNQAGASVVLYVPSLLVGILEEPERRFPRSVRLVVIGGEELTPATVARLRDVFDGTVAHQYGPTETSVACVIGRLPNHGSVDRVPIGRPIDNLRCYVLDSRLRPVPVGAAGELYVGGPGTARGYHGRGGLTADRFVPDPFSYGGERLYRTGDLVRWLPDETLEFVGRVDHQVKVRGFRVEPGEIEAVLAELAQVRQAAVVSRKDGSTTRLVAYLIAHGAPTRISVLRDHLATRLPGHMIPAQFVWLDAFPVTSSGKLNRDALPDPAVVRSEISEEFVAPRDDRERVLAKLWLEVLGVDRVGVHDNFFELGGDSIMTLLVAARAKRVGLRITPRQFFDHPTVASLASVAETISEDIRLRSGSAGDRARVPVTLTPIQRWFFEQDMAEPAYWNFDALFALESEVDTDRIAAALRAVMQEMYRRHQSLRTRFLRESGEWRAEALPPSHVDPGSTVRIIRLDGAGDWTAAVREALDSAQPFDLERPPLLRVLLIDGGSMDRRRLYLVAHHLVVDGVSWRVLLEDLGTGLEQALTGELVWLPSARTTPGQWAEALGRLAVTAEVTDGVDFWLNGQPTDVRGVPWDFVDAPASAIEADTRHVTVALDREETRLLLRETPKAYHTHIDDVLLTAVLWAIADLGGGPRVGLSLEGHGREQHLVQAADLSRTVGWLTSMAPVVLVTPSTGMDRGEALKSTKEQLRSIPLDGLGYGLLRYLNPDYGHRLAELPAPELSFNYLGQFVGAGSGRSTSDAPQSVRLGAAPEEPSTLRHPNNVRPHLVDIAALTAGGRLTMTFSHSTRHHTVDTIERFAAATIAHLRGLITHCVTAGLGGYTPSDFPESGLSQRELDLLIADLAD